MPEPVLQPEEEWIPKKQALRMLAISARHLERRAAQGLVRRKVGDRRPDQTAAPVLYARSDIEALRAGKPNRHAFVDRRPAAPEKAGKSKAVLLKETPLARRAEASLGGLFLRLAEAARAPQPRLWLTLAEAAEFSGLPRSLLRRLARAGQVAALNAGSAARPRWLVSRDALAAWRPS